MMGRLYIQVWRDDTDGSEDMFYDTTRYNPFGSVYGFDTFHSVKVGSTNVMLFGLFCNGQPSLSKNEYRQVLRDIFPEYSFVRRV